MDSFKKHAGLERWAREQARMGVGPQALKSWAIDGGFDPDVVEAVISAAKADGCFESASGASMANSLAENGKWRMSGDARCLMWMKFPELALFGGLASEAQSLAIIENAQARLGPSRVAHIAPRLSSSRASNSASFARGLCREADDLQDAIAALLGIGLSRFEPLVATQYRDGGFYAPHNDSFSKGHPKWGTPKQRVATVVVYLSEPEFGGQTVVEPLGMRFAPALGNALYFAYPDETSKELTLHASAPCQGIKWVATQWVVAG